MLNQSHTQSNLNYLPLPFPSLHDQHQPPKLLHSFPPYHNFTNRNPPLKSPQRKTNKNSISITTPSFPLESHHSGPSPFPPGTKSSSHGVSPTARFLLSYPSIFPSPPSPFPPPSPFFPSFPLTSSPTPPPRLLLHGYKKSRRKVTRDEKTKVQ